MPGMQSPRGNEGGGVTAERSPHENPRGYEEFSPEEGSERRSTDSKEWSLAGKTH